MNQWHPVPAHMAAALSKQTWTPDKPAPEAVGYLWAWHMQHNRSPVSIRELAAWCGWKPWRARKVLEEMRQHADAWSDKTTRIHTATAHFTHSDSTATAQPPHKKHGLSAEKRTANAQSSHTLRTANAHSRARSSYTNKTKPTITNTHSGADGAQPAKPPLVRQVFDAIAKKRQERLPGSRPLKLTKARAASLKARIVEHSADEVLAVVDWWLQAQHPRARYLVENGHGIDTLLRASNFPKYLEFSQDKPGKVNGHSQHRTKPQAAPQAKAKPKPDLPPLSAYTAEQIAKTEAELEPLKAGCTPETWDKMVRTSLRQDHGDMIQPKRGTAA